MVNIAVSGHRNLQDKQLEIISEIAMAGYPSWLFQRRKLYEKN